MPHKLQYNVQCPIVWYLHSKMVWNYSELIMHRTDVRASHYKINPLVLITVSGYK